MLEDDLRNFCLIQVVIAHFRINHSITQSINRSIHQSINQSLTHSLTLFLSLSLSAPELELQPSVLSQSQGIAVWSFVIVESTLSPPPPLMCPFPFASIHFIARLLDFVSFAGHIVREEGDGDGWQRF
jgi:hypothetical protein